MNNIFLLFFLFLFLMVGVISIIRDFVIVKSSEGFQNSTTSTTTTYSIPEGSMEYISCIALDPPTEENKDRIDTTNLVDQAPFWSKFIDFGNKNRDELLNMIAGVLIELSGNQKILKGPIYILMGRNKTTKSGNAWIYTPSILKNGEIASGKTYAYNHQWLRSLLFSSALGISHYLCNNPCDKDITYTADELALMSAFATDIPFQPNCGCIAEEGKACPFVNVPATINMGSRNKDIISSYSVYHIRPEFFTNTNIKFNEPYYLEINRFQNSQIMYEGCDTRLISNNRLHSFEITPNGFAFYDTTQDKPFDENCIPKPNTTSTNDAKTLRDKYDVIGVTPRLVNEDSDLAIYSIVPNQSTGKKEWVKQWTINTVGKKYPFQVYLDNDGKLKIQDDKNIITDVEFVKQT